MNIKHKVETLLERVEALERKVSPECTCSKCTGLPDIESYYKEPEAVEEPVKRKDNPPATFIYPIGTLVLVNNPEKPLHSHTGVVCRHYNFPSALFYGVMIDGREEVFGEHKVEFYSSAQNSTSHKPETFIGVDPAKPGTEDSAEVTLRCGEDGFVVDSIEIITAPESPPPVPSGDDWDAMTGCREYANESTFTSLPSDMFCRLYDYSRHCAKHHTLSRRDSEMLNYVLDLFLRTCPAANECAEGENLIKRLLATLPEEEQL